MVMRAERRCCGRLRWWPGAARGVAGASARKAWPARREVGAGGDTVGQAGAGQQPAVRTSPQR